MQAQIAVGGLTFHWYGLLVGIALVIGWQLIEYRHYLVLKDKKNKGLHGLARSVNAHVVPLVVAIAVGSLIGARLWHLITDWSYYQSILVYDPLSLVAIWRGGMSIIGALAGGLVGLFLASYLLDKVADRKSEQHVMLYILDLSIFGLPIAQAVGRLGNWINQELYGLPTNLPWKMYIEPAARMVGFEDNAYYHPLFAYEAFLTAIFGAGVWALYWYNRWQQKLGTGLLWLTYLCWYSWVRFGLDFLRIDKAEGVFGLGINQLVLLVVAVVSSWCLFLSWLEKQHQQKNQLQITGAVVATLIILASGWHWVQQPLATQIDPDEVVWVLDSQAFTWYTTGNWQKFQLADSFYRLNWWDHQYRIIDQPQLGKYFFGAWLTANNLRPWESNQTLLYYYQFAQQTLPGGSPTESNTAFDKEIIKSIALLRHINTGVGLVTFVLVGLFFGYYFRSKWMTVILFVVLTSQPTIHHYYRLAIVNSHSLLLQFLAVMVMVVSLEKLLMSSTQKAKTSSLQPSLKWVVGTATLAGGLVAAATSVKLDGAFLLIGPMILSFYFLIELVLSKLLTGNDFSSRRLGPFVQWIIIFGVAAGLVFFLLEPELWSNPLNGLQQLLGSRMAQQERFLVAFNDWSVLKVASEMVQASVRGINWWLIFGSTLFWLIASRKLSSSHKTLSTKVIARRVGVCVVVILPMMLGTLYYGRVGFDRYLIPGIVASYILVLGLVEVSMRLYNQFYEKTTSYHHSSGGTHNHDRGDNR